MNNSKVHLIGGGWDAATYPDLYGPFLRQAGTRPVIATVVIDEGDGPHQFRRWADALNATQDCLPSPVLVRLGDKLDVDALGDADGLLVCGGLTPAYAAATEGVGASIRKWLRDGGRPFAGFSAGAAIASTDAVVGGWLIDALPVCPPDSAEDLDEVTVLQGLGLVPFTVDVHCAQWGTLPRLVAVVERYNGAVGVGIDENTSLSWDGGVGEVRGLGNAHLISRIDNRTTIQTLTPGSRWHLDAESAE